MATSLARVHKTVYHNGKRNIPSQTTEKLPTKIRFRHYFDRLCDLVFRVQIQRPGFDSRRYQIC
jgi:hypothetical protein